MKLELPKKENPLILPAYTKQVWAFKGKQIQEKEKEGQPPKALTAAAQVFFA